jgi:hypothetical protein
MAARREKTLNYRRAAWVDENTTMSLEHYIKQMDDKLQTVNEKTISRGDGQHIKIAKLKLNNIGGVFMHIVTDTPGEDASVVPHNSDCETEIDMATTEAPDKFEFMDGDAFIYVRRNDVVICTTNLRDGGVSSYLQALFRRARLSNNSTQFTLLKVANVDKINMINSQGIKEIDLRTTVSKAAMDFSRRKHQTQTIAGAAARHVKAIFGKPNDVTQDALSISIIIKTDYRVRKQLALGEKMIDKLAINLIESQEDDDEFLITTKTGQTISRNEISVKSIASINASGKTVERERAWDKLQEFFNSLKESGITEQ